MSPQQTIQSKEKKIKHLIFLNRKLQEMSELTFTQEQIRTELYSTIVKIKLELEVQFILNRLK